MWRATGVGKRIKLAHTRAIVNAIHSGALANSKTREDKVIGFNVVMECPNVPLEILEPRNTWADKFGYDSAARKLAGLSRGNFMAYESGVGKEVKAVLSASSGKLYLVST